MKCCLKKNKLDNHFINTKSIKKVRFDEKNITLNKNLNKNIDLEILKNKLINNDEYNQYVDIELSIFNNDNIIIDISNLTLSQSFNRMTK